MGASSSVPKLGPSPPGVLQQFLEGQDLGALAEKPLVFETDPRVVGYDCCLNCIVGCSSTGITCLFCPIGVCCPGWLYPLYSLKLDAASVQLHSARNDFCCHIQESVRTLPLDKVQDVQITQNCLHSCFGVHQVSVQSAGTSSPDAGAEISATFLRDPAAAREALLLAVRLARAGAAPAPVAGMTRAAAAASAGGRGELAGRLAELEALVRRGALAPPEARAARVPALAAASDPLPRLAEAFELSEAGAITVEEYEALKAALLARLSAGGGAVPRVA